MIRTQLQNLDIPRLEAELLLAWVLNKPRSYLYAHPEQTLTPDQQAYLQTLVKRRQQGEPIAYICQQKEFWSLPLWITPATLIPRPETEHLVEWVLATLPADLPLTIADLGTGSGAIALALAKERKTWQIVATDQSAAALQVAKINADNLGITHVAFYLGNWCQALPQQKYAAIVSNPPYIAAEDMHLNQGDLRFEPKSALVAEEEGLKDLKTIIHQAIDYLHPSGWLALEHGYAQGNAVRDLLYQMNFLQIKTYPDFAGQDRFTVGQLS